MAGVLTISQYLGGPDNVQLEQVFPGDQKILQYDFPGSISGWGFLVEAQTIIVNPVAFDRDGTPNFSTSEVVGYFAKTTVADTRNGSTSTYVRPVNNSAGIVNIVVPKDLYTGPILPDARANVPITVVSVSWTGISDPVTGTPAPTSAHRWAFMQCWAPGVTPGDPTIQTVTTTITGSSVDQYTRDGQPIADYIFVTDTAGIRDGAIFYVGTDTCVVADVVDSVMVHTPYSETNPQPFISDLPIGSSITFHNYTNYFSLV